jgi:hypothetical protein
MRECLVAVAGLALIVLAGCADIGRLGSLPTPPYRTSEAPLSPLPSATGAPNNVEQCRRPPNCPT